MCCVLNTCAHTDEYTVCAVLFCQLRVFLRSYTYSELNILHAEGLNDQQPGSLDIKCAFDQVTRNMACSHVRRRPSATLNNSSVNTSCLFTYVASSGWPA